MSDRITAKMLEGQTRLAIRAMERAYQRGYEDGLRERLDPPNATAMRSALRAKFEDRQQGVDRFESVADAAHQTGRLDALDGRPNYLDQANRR